LKRNTEDQSFTVKVISPKQHKIKMSDH